MITREYSKKEIATLLRDYYNLMKDSSDNKNTKFFTLFYKEMEEQNRINDTSLKYYSKMVEIFALQLTRKYMTLLYDNMYKYLNDNKISNIFIPDTIFVNKEDRKRFSNKQIIKYIRNALNHNDKSDLYKIVEIEGSDKPVIEIKSLETKPIPFHVIISANELAKIANSIRCSGAILACTIQSNEVATPDDEFLDSVYLQIFYPERKLNDQEYQALHNHFSSGKETRGYEHRLAIKGLVHKDFHLNKLQRRMLKEELKDLAPKGPQEVYSVAYIFKKYFPLSVVKERQLFINLAFMEHVRADSSCANSLSYEAYERYNSKNVKKGEPLWQYINKYGIDERLLQEAQDINSIMALSHSIYYGYLFDTVVTDDELEIDGEISKRARIRNSFVHMRWHIRKDKGYQLYDWGDRADCEFNPDSKTYWTEKLTYDKVDRLAEKYFQETVGEVSINIDPSVEIFYCETMNSLILRLIRGGKQYIYNVNPDSYEYYGKLFYLENKILKETTVDEKIMFLKNLDTISVANKEKYKDILESAKNKLLEDIQGVKVTESDDMTKQAVLIKHK